MHSILEEATAELPEAKRTSAIKADMAVAILARAASGERNPTALKMSAVSAVSDRSQYSHDISESRRAVWLNGILMRALGISLMVGGMAFLLSGLVFLLPPPTKKAPGAWKRRGFSTLDRWRVRPPLTNPSSAFKAPVKVPDALNDFSFVVSPGGGIAGSGERHGGAIARLAGQCLGGPDRLVGSGALNGYVVAGEPSIVAFGYGHGGVPSN
jgi:hypothetical protein